MKISKQRLCLYIVLLTVSYITINYQITWTKNNQLTKPQVAKFLNDLEYYFSGFIPNYLIPYQDDRIVVRDEKKRTLFKTYAEQTRQLTKNLKPKIILWYIRLGYIKNTPHLEPLNCPDKCVFTTNKLYHNVSSALLWSTHQFKGPIPTRYNDQVFVLHNHEPQCFIQHLYSTFQKTWTSQFNWTMTYRNDSDIVEPYGLIVKRKSSPYKDYNKIFEKKSKMAVVLISHCPTQSDRMKYIDKLRQYGVEVDIMGSCGPIQCPRHKDEECFKRAITEYKFFLSFESSFCPDYVTEKFFRYFRGDIVTVARGGGEYANIAPKNTFLNTRDFSSVKDLANRILELNSNRDEYISYLKRKDEYESLYEDYPNLNPQGQVTYPTYHYELKPMCYLCHRLWNVDSYPRKWYDDVTQWLKKRECYKPDDI